MKKNIIILFLLSFLFSGNINAQTSDSTKIVSIIENFFEWYVEVIKEEAYPEYSPQFVEDENGNTTLDYSLYMNNLKKLSFSKELIEQEKKAYESCIENLLEVKYTMFDSVFDELDDYETAQCDFFNSYRWIGSMELIDGVNVKEVITESEKGEVKLQFYNYYPKDSTFYYWNSSTSIFLLKENNEWKINIIE
ncbi:hypothetical protein L3049_05395 [Labilibaculum sp. DW002]|uniref:DUF3828 domain-containing protein n=1 Tax=Paralabilibaculum antarcticum TaxID=2912572 RepID=A0ABT5VQ84_9BACT|nr:hypothetical protein [Labilibaculum sp. DW002]MDE5417436.1 hypothetical protein [Labilibaculum sp. DW002]